MTYGMEDVKELGTEMEQLSQNDDYPIDSSNDEAYDDEFSEDSKNNN